MTTNDEHQSFMKRTATLYREHKRRAKELDQLLDYELEDVRRLVSQHVGDHHCHYCRGPVEVDNFSVDRKVPVVRNGSFSFSNLVITCESCHLAKGPLDHFEFRELLAMLQGWPEPVRKNFLTRLTDGSTPGEKFELAPIPVGHGVWG